MTLRLYILKEKKIVKLIYLVGTLITFRKY